MDVDPPATQNDDLEQQFLTQFSCLGTSEKDDLVNQFQYIGNEPSQQTAKFFLDMNNWNLQAAVGCYFDYMASVRQPSMKIIKSCTVGEGESITPCTPFTVSWLVQNSGETEWPAGTCLKEVSVQALDDMSIPVPALSPMDTTKITIRLVSPAELGDYCTKWRLCTPSKLYFGATITCVVNVSESGTMALTQQMEELHVPNNIPQTVIEYINNDERAGNNTNNVPQTTAINNSSGGGGGQAGHIADEEMWDDVL